MIQTYEEWLSENREIAQDSFIMDNEDLFDDYAREMYNQWDFEDPHPPRPL
jgi:hypothetical protein